MSERENGWYLRSDGYMTSECSYQRITARNGNRALDNHGKLVFVKFMGGDEVDNRVYVPERTCEYKPMWDEEDELAEEYLGMWYTGCGDALIWNADNDGCCKPPAFCPYCRGRVVKR